VFKFEDRQYLPIVGLSLKNLNSMSCGSNFPSLTNIKSSDSNLIRENLLIFLVTKFSIYFSVNNLIRINSGNKRLPIKMKSTATKRSKSFIKFLVDGSQTSEGIEFNQSESNSIEKVFSF